MPAEMPAPSGKPGVDMTDKFPKVSTAQLFFYNNNFALTALFRSKRPPIRPI
jgi:hypothetical protein